MDDKNFKDELNKGMDEIFKTAQQFTDFFQEKMKDGFEFDGCFDGKRGPRGPFDFGKDPSKANGGTKDYYTAYNYPPLNIYSRKDRSIVFEFALAGFNEEDLKLQFHGDFMVFSAKAPEESTEDTVKYYKRRLKLKDIDFQKYYVPEEKFDQGAVKATFKNNILKVVIPSKDEYSEDDGIKVEIVSEEE